MYKKKSTLAIASILISFIVLVLKVKAYYVTNSVSVLSDALETVVNVITAFVAFATIKLAESPADEEHPYGHGKFEYFSAAFEGGLIFFAALAIAFQSIKSFFIPHELQNISEGNIYILLATVLNLVFGLILIYQSKNNNSEALKASGKHILADVVTSLGVVVGLYLVTLTGLVWIDSGIGLIIAFWLTAEAYKIVRFSSGALLDEVDKDAIENLSEVLNKHKKSMVIDIHHVRMIRSGGFHHIDAHMVVPEYLNVATVHAVTHEFEQQVVKDYKFDGEFAFHIDPCKQAYCKKCDMTDCTIRKSEFKVIEPLTAEHIIKGPRYTN